MTRGRELSVLRRRSPTGIGRRRAGDWSFLCEQDRGDPRVGVIPGEKGYDRVKEANGLTFRGVRRTSEKLGSSCWHRRRAEHRAEARG